MDYRDLVEGLGRSLGIEDFKSDDGGHYNLGIDEFVVSFGENLESGRLDMVARICELTADEAGPVCKVLLAAMEPGGSAGDCTFFITDDSCVYLRWTGMLALLDVEGLRLALERFVNALEDWRGEIGNFRRALPVIGEAVQRQSDEDRRLAIKTDGFLQV